MLMPSLTRAKNAAPPPYGRSESDFKKLTSVNLRDSAYRCAMRTKRSPTVQRGGAECVHDYLLTQSSILPSAHAEPRTSAAMPANTSNAPPIAFKISMSGPFPLSRWRCLAPISGHKLPLPLVAWGLRSLREWSREVRLPKR